MRHNMYFDMILRGIVATRGESGATINEMRSDYQKLIGDPWPLDHINRMNRVNYKNAIKYLMEIDGLMMEEFETGLCVWYIDDIGSHVSEESTEQELDSNNNVIVVDDQASSVAMTSSLDNEQPANSYALPAPRRRNVTSSFVNGQGVSLSTSDSLIIAPMENCKRALSQESQPQQIKQKRQKLLESARAPLNEKNLDIHNRKNGADSMLKQTTSTEIGNSSSQCDLNRCIMANDYIAPITVSEANQIHRAFAKSCTIIEHANPLQSESADSTVSVKDRLFPEHIGIIGDDFMRSLISFELYGGDFTGQNDEGFGLCVSRQTIREAYHLLLNRNQYTFTSKYRYVIVNVGAFDILMERCLNDIITDYARLISTIMVMGLVPIITSIPRVCINKNNPNYKCMYQTLLLFNQFLMDKYSKDYLFIDLFPVLFDEPMATTKSKQQFELWRWTENGRKKILRAIHAFIETRLPE